MQMVFYDASDVDRHCVTTGRIQLKVLTALPLRATKDIKQKKKTTDLQSVKQTTLCCAETKNKIRIKVKLLTIQTLNEITV